jgi:hypothetical protein
LTRNWSWSPLHSAESVVNAIFCNTELVDEIRDTYTITLQSFNAFLRSQRVAVLISRVRTFVSVLSKTVGDLSMVQYVLLPILGCERTIGDSEESCRLCLLAADGKPTRIQGGFRSASCVEGELEVSRFGCWTVLEGSLEMLALRHVAC